MNYIYLWSCNQSKQPWMHCYSLDFTVNEFRYYPHLNVGFGLLAIWAASNSWRAKLTPVLAVSPPSYIPRKRFFQRLPSKNHNKQRHRINSKHSEDNDVAIYVFIRPPLGLITKANYNTYCTFGTEDMTPKSLWLLPQTAANAAIIFICSMEKSSFKAINKSL